MPRTKHGYRLAGITGPIRAEYVRHAVDNFRGCLAFADRRQSIGTSRIGRGPGPGRVDHGVGAQDLRPLAVLIADFERGLFAAFGLGLVKTDAADGGDAARS